MTEPGWMTASNNYLGETPIDISSHPTYKDWTPSDWALYFVGHYGQIDGDHHKLWVLDQVARILKGTPIIGKLAKWKDGTTEERFETGDPSSEYRAWVDEMRGDVEEDGSREYSYDEGIAP